MLYWIWMFSLTPSSHPRVKKSFIFNQYNCLGNIGVFIREAFALCHHCTRNKRNQIYNEKHSIIFFRKGDKNFTAKFIMKSMVLILASWTDLLRSTSFLEISLEFQASFSSNSSCTEQCRIILNIMHNISSLNKMHQCVIWRYREHIRCPKAYWHKPFQQTSRRYLVQYPPPPPPRCF